MTKNSFLGKNLIISSYTMLMELKLEIQEWSNVAHSSTHTIYIYTHTLRFIITEKVYGQSCPSYRFFFFFDAVSLCVCINVNTKLYDIYRQIQFVALCITMRTNTTRRTNYVYRMLHLVCSLCFDYNHLITNTRTYTHSHTGIRMTYVEKFNPFVRMMSIYFL